MQIARKVEPPTQDWLHACLHINYPTLSRASRSRGHCGMRTGERPWDHILCLWKKSDWQWRAWVAYSSWLLCWALKADVSPQISKTNDYMLSFIQPLCLLPAFPFWNSLHYTSILPSPRRLLGDCSRLPWTNAESLIVLFTVVFSGLFQCMLFVTGVVADFWMLALAGADFAWNARNQDWGVACCSFKNGLLSPSEVYQCGTRWQSA